MKHLSEEDRKDPNANLLTNTSKVLAKAKSDRKSGNGDHYKHVCHIPRSVYDIVHEVTFRDDITLRAFATEAVDRLAESCDSKRPVIVQRHCVDWSEAVVHSTIFFSRESKKSIKAIKHYSNISIDKIIVEAMMRHLAKSYGDKYPDIPGIPEEYANPNEKA